MNKIFRSLCLMFFFVCGGLFLIACQEDEEITEKDKMEVETFIENKYGYEGVDLYYGKFRGYIVFLMTSILPAEKIAEIGNEVFWFSSQDELWTFKDNSLVLLEKVYDRGDLKDKDIEKIHQKYLEETKKIKGDYDTWYKTYLEKVDFYRNSKTDNLDQLKTYWSGSDTKIIEEVWKNTRSGSCTINCKLGKYNYSFVFLQVGTKEQKSTIIVANQEFIYPKEFTIWVYKDRDIILKEEIITLEEAYQKAYLSSDDIKEIHTRFVDFLNEK